MSYFESCRRKIKCLLGRHDWNILESRTSGSIEHDLTGSWFIEVDYDSCVYHRSICLWCGKYVDGISERMNYVAKILGEREARKEQGRMLHAALYGSQEINLSNNP